jgi:hypothetical protein
MSANIVNIQQHRKRGQKNNKPYTDLLTPDLVRGYNLAF